MSWVLANESEVPVLAEFCSQRLAWPGWVRGPEWWVDYVSWYVDNQLCAVYCDEAGALLGMIMGRPVKHVHDGVFYRTGKLEGKGLWVEAVILNGLSFIEATKFALQTLAERGFEFDWLAWNRTPKRRTPVVLPIGKLNKLEIGLAKATC